MEIERKASFVDRLREAMADTGKKQIDLVRETGLDRASINRYLAGKHEPKQKAINRLAIALDVDEMWLWGYDVPKIRTPEQKKNDDLVKVIAQLRRDPEFFDVVSRLAELPPEQYASVKTILAGLGKK